MTLPAHLNFTRYQIEVTADLANTFFAAERMVLG
jgi:hypothetical protein